MIHYHGSPFGGKRSEVTQFFRNRFAFVSWLRDEDLPTIADVGRGFAIDNGAFTAWKSGEAVNWEQYIRYLREWSRHPRFQFAVIPDTIDGTEQDNRDLVKFWDKRAWHPWYIQGAAVWHLHESLGWLDQLVSGRRLVCLGSSGDYATPNTKAWINRMDEAMRVICDSDGRPRTKIHGLRMLAPSIVERFPFASADSTNVVQNANLMSRFGMYQCPTRSQRAEAIANCIEGTQSPATYIKHSLRQGEWLFELE